MKNIVTLMALMFVLTISNAQIPNAGFEDWNNVGTYSNPVGWFTMNNTTASSNIFTAAQGTPGYPGNSCIKLTSKSSPNGVINGKAVSGKYDSIANVILSGFPYSSRPTHLTGAWQHMIFGSSQGSIAITFTKWNPALPGRDIIGSASATLSGMAMSWQNFAIPMVYFSANTPDSCIIVMRASGTAPTDGDYLWVDNLAFTGVTAIEEKVFDAFSIYPNPAQADQVLQFNLLQSGNVKGEIYSLEGKKISTLFDTYFTAGLQSIKLDLQSTDKATALTQGIYFLHVSSNQSSQMVKMIIE